jgi:hypothetical protein
VGKKKLTRCKDGTFNHPYMITRTVTKRRFGIVVRYDFKECPLCGDHDLDITHPEVDE